MEIGRQVEPLLLGGTEMKYHRQLLPTKQSYKLQVVVAANSHHEEPGDEADGERNMGKEDGKESSVNIIT